MDSAKTGNKGGRVPPGVQRIEWWGGGDQLQGGGGSQEKICNCADTREGSREARKGSSGVAKLEKGRSCCFRVWQTMGRKKCGERCKRTKNENGNTGVVKSRGGL